jgi:glycosyltransferase involved in cell wall biosynthesis
LALRGRAHLLDLQMDVHRIYRGIDLYVHASDTEGFSNALLEAMSHGKPVVATGVGGNVEAVQDGESGRLTPVRDSRRMAESILMLLRDPQLAARIGSAARRRIGERFTFDRMLRGYIDLYHEEMAGV